MNDATWEFWRAYIQDVAGFLGLRDRDVVLRREPPPSDEAVAEVWTQSDVVKAVIYLHPDFFYRCMEEQRQIVCHELIHLHLTALEEHIEWALGSVTGSDLLANLPKLIRRDIETAVDRIAYIVAPRVPLPIDSARGDVPCVDAR